MADVLSQSQIDELLNNLNAGGEKAIEEITEQNTEKKAKSYDFRMPKKFTKERIRILDRIFENYARLLSSYFTGLLRLYCKVNVLQIEEQRYYEFNNALPEYVLMGICDLGVDDVDVDDTNLIMQISNQIAYTILDRLLGGNGDYVDVARDFTEIETGLMKNIIKKMCSLQKESWSIYIDTNPTMVSMETNSRIVQSIAPDDVIIQVIFEVEIRDIKNTISLCIPAMNLEQIMVKFQDRNMKNSKRCDVDREKERKTNIMKGIKNTTLPIKAVLADTQVDMGDIITLQVGDIIPLNKNINSNVTVKIGETTWFDGKLGCCNGKKAIKIDNTFRN